MCNQRKEPQHQHKWLGNTGRTTLHSRIEATQSEETQKGVVNPPQVRLSIHTSRNHKLCTSERAKRKKKKKSYHCSTIHFSLRRVDQKHNREKQKRSERYKSRCE